MSGAQAKGEAEAAAAAEAKRAEDHTSKLTVGNLEALLGSFYNKTTR